MRILLVTPMPPDATAPGAIPALLHAELLGLSRRNEVTLVCVAGPDPDELAAVERLRADGFDVHAATRTEPRGAARWRRRARFAHGWLVRRWPWRTVWFFEPEAQRIIDRVLREQRFDVIAVEDDAAAVYDFGADVPAVLTQCEVGRSLPSATGSRLADALLERDFRRWPRYQRETSRLFRFVLVFSTRDREELVALDPGLRDRIRVTPFGVDIPELADGGIVPDTLMFAGNYTHPPNVDAARWLALEILPRVRELRPGARLQLLGIHAPAEILALGAQDGVEVLGAVPDLAPFFARAAVVMAPIRTGGGMRMKVLHAMASGKAVVTTPLGSEGLSEDGTPPLALGADADALARVSADLLADPAACAELGARARAFVVERYGPDAYARRLERVYEEAVAGGPRRPGDGA